MFENELGQVRPHSGRCSGKQRQAAGPLVTAQKVGGGVGWVGGRGRGHVEPSGAGGGGGGGVGAVWGRW